MNCENSPQQIQLCTWCSLRSQNWTLTTETVAAEARKKFGAAPPWWTLRSFGSKCTVLRKVLVTLLGLFGAHIILSPVVTPLLCIDAFLYCVKRSVHENRLIKPFTRARWSQSHTNNECFKLVEALLQIYSCFFSHTIGYNYTWLAAISSFTVSLHYLPRCLCSTAHAGLPFSDFK